MHGNEHLLKNVPDFMERERYEEDMIDPNNLCIGCMNIWKSVDVSCPYCGINKKEYLEKISARVLRPQTILAGKYMIGKVLGEGGFGITYLGWDLNLEQKVAIKEYFPVGLATRDMRNDDSALFSIVSGNKQMLYTTGLNNFVLEAKNLAKFQNLPGVVSVKDFFYENQTAYLVMEFLEGINLKQYLNSDEKKCFSEEKTLEIMRPVIDALIMIHKTGLIHRDISPENIIMTKERAVKLIDFGAARMATGVETLNLTVLLKHGYAPMEQYQTNGKQGPWTDVYSLCATMYYLMSGKIPQAAIDRILEDKVENLWSESLCDVSLGKIEKQISKRVSDIIEKGLEVKIEERYQNVEELKRELYSSNMTKDNVVVAQSTRQINSDTEIQKETSKGKVKIRNMCFLLSMLVILFFSGYFISSDRKYNAYETVKEHAEVIELTSDEQAEYYIEKAKLAFEAEDYSQSLFYCEESLSIKTSMVPFFKIAQIYDKQDNIKKMVDIWSNYKQEWSEAWERATDDQRRQGANIMMDAMMDRCKESVVWILGKENITSYLEYFSDLFADYGTDEQKITYQKYYIEMIEIAAKEGKIRDKLAEFETCFVNNDSFSIVKEHILDIYEDKLKGLQKKGDNQKAIKLAENIESVYGKTEYVSSIKDACNESLKEEKEILNISKDIKKYMSNKEYTKLAAYFRKLESNYELSNRIYYKDKEIVTSISSGKGLVWYFNTYGYVYYGEFRDGKPDGQGVQFSNNVENDKWWISSGNMVKGMVYGNCTYISFLNNGAKIEYTGEYIPDFGDTYKSLADGNVAVQWDGNSGTFQAERGHVNPLRMMDDENMIYVQDNHPDGSWDCLYRAKDSEFFVNNLFPISEKELKKYTD